MNSEDQAQSVLLATKLLHVCSLSYFNSHLSTTYAQKEKQLIESLGINEYKVWDIKHLDENTGVETITSQAVSGVIDHIVYDLPKKTPFICFRGTSSFHDILVDVLSLIPTTFMTLKGVKVATSGAGMVAAYTFLRELGIVEYALKHAEQYEGLVICGHSLGGALATILVAELLVDHKVMFNHHPLRLVTFGSPRVFDKHFSHLMDRSGCNYYHYRFINEKDIVTALPPSEFPFRAFLSSLKLFDKVAHNNRLYHTGIAYYAPTNRDEWHLKSYFTDFDYAPHPNMKDIWSIIECLLTFAVSFGDQHNLLSSGGYLDKLIHSKQYSDGIQYIKKQLQNLMKERVNQDITINSEKRLSISSSKYSQNNLILHNDTNSSMTSSMTTTTTTTKIGIDGITANKSDNHIVRDITDIDARTQRLNDVKNIHENTDIVTPMMSPSKSITETESKVQYYTNLLQSFDRLPVDIEQKDGLKSALQSMVVLGVTIARKNMEHAQTTGYIWLRRLGLILLGMILLEVIVNYRKIFTYITWNYSDVSPPFSTPMIQYTMTNDQMYNALSQYMKCQIYIEIYPHKLNTENTYSNDDDSNDGCMGDISQNIDDMYYCHQLLSSTSTPNTQLVSKFTPLEVQLENEYICYLRHYMYNITQIIPITVQISSVDDVITTQYNTTTTTNYDHINHYNDTHEDIHECSSDICSASSPISMNRHFLTSLLNYTQSLFSTSINLDTDNYNGNSNRIHTPKEIQFGVCNNTYPLLILHSNIELLNRHLYQRVLTHYMNYRVQAQVLSMKSKALSVISSKRTPDMLAKELYDYYMKSYKKLHSIV